MILFKKYEVNKWIIENTKKFWFVTKSASFLLYKRCENLSLNFYIRILNFAWKKKDFDSKHNYSEF